jgi:hypothetical protein
MNLLGVFKKQPKVIYGSVQKIVYKGNDVTLELATNTGLMTYRYTGSLVFRIGSKVIIDENGGIKLDEQMGSSRTYQV